MIIVIHPIFDSTDLHYWEYLKSVLCESMINSPNIIKDNLIKCVIIESSEVARKPEIILITNVQVYGFCTARCITPKLLSHAGAVWRKLDFISSL